MDAQQEQEKEKLRERLLEKRKSISEPEYYGASADIIEQLKDQQEYKQARVIHSYVSMNNRREVETRELIKEMLRIGKQVIVPVTNFEKGTLDHVKLRSYQDLETNKWGVLEPARGEEVSPENFELVIVPMVAGDIRGNRMGYGQGFYDRFLVNVACPKIGLIFKQNVVDELPTEEFDIPMDKIITEERVIRCQ